MKILFGQMRLPCLVIGYEMNAHCISDISLAVFACGMDRVALMLFLLYSSRFAFFFFSTNKSVSLSASEREAIQIFTEDIYNGIESISFLIFNT
jgi:hypothetical protein